MWDLELEAADGEKPIQAVLAVKAGYRHIDAAAIYQMKRWSGDQDSGLKRETCLLPEAGVLITL